MTPVETLRAAAEKARYLATEASKPENNHPWGDRDLAPTPPSEWPAEMAGYLGGIQGDYCAAWHPSVTAHLADAWDALAESLQAIGTPPNSTAGAALVAAAVEFLGGAS